MKKFKVGFIGVGKLGQSCAEMMAEVHDVVGYDIRPRSPTNFLMVDGIADAVQDRDIVFVAVETPHDPLYDGKAPTSHLPNKDFDYTIVKQVLQQVNEVANKDQLVVLISTVLPGTTRREFAPLLKNTRFVYNPYLIAMGTVKWDMVNPEMVMIGTHDGDTTADARELEEFYRTIMLNNPRYVIGTWEEIESVKVFYNTFISAKVSLVNMIQDVAEKLGNMNSELVCDALAASTRRIMGPAYMKPGMGDGGACHPRDNIALRYLAEQLDLGYDLFDAVMKSREQQAKNMANTLIELAKKSDTPMPIVIVGKAYKPLVPYTDGSSSMLVGHYLEESGHTFYYHDYCTGDVVPNNLGPAVYLLAHDPDVTYGEQLDHVKEFMQSRNVAEADRAFEVLKGLYLAPAAGSVIVDPWRKVQVDPELGISVVHYGNTRGV